jgi:gliding motility-associated-like protein/uncharacterized repeat protein (TIGR01451 family)
VTGVSNGTATITYAVTNIGGCSSSKTMDVTVTATPPTPAINPAGSTSICAGNSVVLTASATGATTYQWYFNGTAISGATAATYTANAAGDYTVTAANAGGCTSGIAMATTVTVNPTPATPSVNAGASTTFCSGGNVILTANATGAATYQWYLNGTAIPGATAVNYTAATAGDYTVGIASAAGCTSAISPAVTITNGTPSVAPITGNQTICVGVTTTLSDATAGGAWSSGNTAVATIDAGGNVTGVSGGTATITYAVTGTGGCTANVTYTITVYAPAGMPTITASGTNVCPGAPVTLTASATGAMTYQWYLNGSAITGATTGAVYTVTQPGSYTVVATNAGGCTSLASAAQVITSTCTVVPMADLVVNKQVSAGPYSTDKPVSYGITVKNLGPNTAQDVVVSDTLSASLGDPTDFITTGTDPVYDPTTRVIQWHIPSLDSGAVMALTFSIDIKGTGAISNTATVNALTGDPDTSSNHSTAIFTLNGDIVIPNVFTPNGDGKNDKFVIVGLAKYPGSSLRVYNRWGNEVYRSDSYNNDWNGSNLNDGTYYYILLLNTTQGKQPYKGWVEILHK